MARARESMAQAKHGEADKPVAQASARVCNDRDNDTDTSRDTGKGKDNNR